MYIHEQPEWPRLTWSSEHLVGALADVRHQQGRLLGRMEGLGFSLQQEAFLETLTADVVKTSEIEGERLDTGQVRSSIARRLGIDIGGLKPANRHVEGVVAMMLDATGNYRQPLTVERLFSWHGALFPTGRSGLARIRTGGFRSGPMQVISGPFGRERVHFEAPAASRLDREMVRFVDWFNQESDGADPVLKAGLTHLWFVTVHPFDDGNGRIARALTDMQLARSEDSSQRFYSMSAQIQQERGDYYAMLERTQKGTTDITAWMVWFLACLGRAIQGANSTVALTLGKANFWERLSGVPLNHRQRTMINRLLDGFEGKLTTAKWAKLAKCSHDTALRDIHALIDRRVLMQDAGGGRSTSYSLASETSDGSSNASSSS